VEEGLMKEWRKGLMKASRKVTTVVMKVVTRATKVMEVLTEMKEAEMKVLMTGKKVRMAMTEKTAMKMVMTGKKVMKILMKTVMKEVVSMNHYYQTMKILMKKTLTMKMMKILTRTMMKTMKILMMKTRKTRN
jgi:hypothetical protein